MPGEKKDQRVTFMMSASELQRLDDWAFASRIRSRGEAIRRLLKVAVAEHQITNRNGKQSDIKTLPDGTRKKS